VTSLTAQNLCLHYLDPSGRRRLALTPDALRAVVTSRRDAGQHAVALAAHTTPDAFTLSFDDAHRSVLTHAAPVLRALDAPATLFVPTAWVGMSDEFLSWDELRALRDLGWTLGAHSVTHPRMSWRLHGEDDAAMQSRLDEECARAREVMERELGIDVTLFAYPYGEAPAPAREAVRRAGYTTAFTVSDTLAWEGDPLRVPRLDGAPERAPRGGPRAPSRLRGGARV
jgi:peptidoglycan/xylan/chitin deacetylase (PgdA/CDA1 family)